MTHSPLLPAAFAEAADIAATGRFPDHAAAELQRTTLLNLSLTLVQLAGKAVSQSREGDLRGFAKTCLRLCASAACAAIEARRRLPPRVADLGTPPLEAAEETAA